MLKRIGYIVNAFPKISETFVIEEICELLRRGIDVRILSLSRPDEPFCHDIVHRYDLMSRVTCDRERFEEWLQMERPDLLHAHFATQPTAVACQLSVDHGVPFTFTAHGYDVYRKAPQDLPDRAAMARSVITVSAANAYHLESEHQIPSEKIHVVACGIDVRRFHPVERADVLATHVVCVARLAPVKNIPLLIEACESLRNANVALRCSIVGDGRCRPQLEALISQRNLHDQVQLKGALDQEHVTKMWQSADIGVLCSTSEGMPVSLMEAAACGVPVVATSVGGVPELVQDGVTGHLVPSGDVGELSDALRSLIEDPELRKTMSREARKHAVERFSIESQVDRLLQVWKQSVSQPPAAP